MRSSVIMASAGVEQHSGHDHDGGTRAAAPITGYDDAVTQRAGDGAVAGPQDRVTDEQPASDAVRLRESDPVKAQLQDRMERLPPGHPSSPYNDDGSRKPPVPDPFKNDYPIPGDPDYRDDLPCNSESDHPRSEQPGDTGDRGQPADADAADENLADDSETDRSLDEEDTPRIGPDGSWEWKGSRLTGEQSRSADNRVAKCREAEGRDMDDGYGQRGITPAMRRIEAQLGQGELVQDTEKFALKSADRFKEKLARMISDEPDADWRELVPRIADGIRYTFCFPDEGYSFGVMEASDSLTSAGFQLYERKNAWADETKSYKGVNSTWMDRDSGLLFEVQMHTAGSWSAKQESHREYEIIGSRNTTAAEKALARERQDRIFAKVPMPDGALEIPTYRKEGW